MEIEFEPEGLEQTALGSIIGKVHYQFWVTQFPADDWDDFVVVVANWWLVALLELRGSSQARTRFSFMDGPFWMDAQRDGETVLLQCVEDRGGGGITHNETVRLVELEAAVLKFARRVLNAVVRCGMASPDAEELRRRLNESGAAESGAIQS